jgi:hypothetical protein
MLLFAVHSASPARLEQWRARQRLGEPARSEPGLPTLSRFLEPFEIGCVCAAVGCARKQTDASPPSGDWPSTKVEELAARRIRQFASSARGRDVLDAPPGSLEQPPLAIYACDRDGRIRWFNTHAAELWGMTPCTFGAGEKYCGSHKLYLGGRQVAGDESPMALVLRTGIAVRGRKQAQATRRLFSLGSCAYGARRR